MKDSYLNVLIADDENLVREGLKYIIDWEDLGFCISAEACNGKDAYDKIFQLHPDLILLDIRMPLLSGTELIKQAREKGFEGEFIILSGFSDFQYAQTALKYGASDYLTKPIHEEKLIHSVLHVKDKILAKIQQTTSMNQYFSKAKISILNDLFLKSTFDRSINYHDFDLIYPVYQVVLYEGYTPFFAAYNFSELLCGVHQKEEFYEHIYLNQQDIMLLKGQEALNRLTSCLSHYTSGTQKGSPLDSIFLAYSSPFYNIEEISLAYKQCQLLMKRRFFCEENQHVLSFYDLPHNQETTPFCISKNAIWYGDTLLNCIKSFNRRLLSETLQDLKTLFLSSCDDIIAIKHFLADIFIQVKQDIIYTYSYLDIPSPPNAICIKTIENKYYLYEIFLYFTEQFDLFMNAIGNHSNESIFDDILFYIKQNYARGLKLETIAPLFGYNSAYLGKLFTQRMGKSFNSYLDEIRILNSIEFLTKTDHKIYEISSLIGYSSVNYFHQKFKKTIGCSPAEYRKKNGIEII